MKICAAIVFLSLASIAHAQTSKNGFEIKTISTRADLISGGDVLVQVTAPAEAVLRVSVGGRDVSTAFRVGSTPNTRVGLVTGLPNGKSVIDVRVGTRISPPDYSGPPASSLPVVNYPITGPVFSGPQIQPFTFN